MNASMRLNATQLFFAPGTPEPMQKLVQSFPPYDLLKAYRDATVAFNTTDIVILPVVRNGEMEGYDARPRSAYIEKAFQQWIQRYGEQGLQTHPLPIARESAHKRTALPTSTPAFWFVVQSENGGIEGCAIGTLREAAILESTKN